METFKALLYQARYHLKKRDYKKCEALFLKLKARYKLLLKKADLKTAKHLHQELTRLHTDLIRLESITNKKSVANSASASSVSDEKEKKINTIRKEKASFFSKLFQKKQRAIPSTTTPLSTKKSDDKNPVLSDASSASTLPRKKVSFFKGFFAQKKYAEKPSLELSKILAERYEGKEKKTFYTVFDRFRKKFSGEGIIHERRGKLKFYLERAGIELEPRYVSRRIFLSALVTLFILSIYVVYMFALYPAGFRLQSLLVIISLLWTAGFLILLVVLWSMWYIFLDLKIFKRKMDLEEVLPDFLQLTASNIRAGMPIDRALWYAIRPRFGVLAREIEIVAKETMSGKDLKEALYEFSSKYDSNTLHRSINLLVEGLEAGGEIGDLLNKLSLNIQELRILHKDMTANVMTYVIFISFATVFAAPFLFALSHQLIKIVDQLSKRIDVGGAATSGFGLVFTGASVSSSDFQIFVTVSLLITSFFSSVIIATIRKGNVRSGLRYIPVFIIMSIVFFFVSDILLSKLFGVFF